MKFDAEVVQASRGISATRLLCLPNTDKFQGEFRDCECRLEKLMADEGDVFNRRVARRKLAAIEIEILVIKARHDFALHDGLEHRESAS